MTHARTLTEAHSDSTSARAVIRPARYAVKAKQQKVKQTKEQEKIVKTKANNKQNTHASTTQRDLCVKKKLLNALTQCAVKPQQQTTTENHNKPQQQTTTTNHNNKT